MERATEVYDGLARAHGVGSCSNTPRLRRTAGRRPTTRIVSGSQAAGRAARASGRCTVGFIGAGNYASSMLLPHLARLSSVSSGARGHQQVAVRGGREAEVRVLRRDHQR